MPDIPTTALAILNTLTPEEEELVNLIATARAVKDSVVKPTTESKTLLLFPDKQGLARTTPDAAPVYALRLSSAAEHCQVMYTPQQEHVARFEMGEGFEGFEHEVRIETKRAEFEEDAEWIHTQAKGQWSVRVEIEAKIGRDDFLFLNERKDREHTVVYSFERVEDAVLFKMFRT